MRSAMSMPRRRSTFSLDGQGSLQLHHILLTGRLAFLNAQAALEALPRVIDIMATELNWSRARKQQEWNATLTYLKTMGLPEKWSKLTRAQVEKGEVAKFENIEEYRRYTRHDGPSALKI